MGKKQIELFKKYKPLMKQLVIKDIKLKYRRSFLGYIWSILNPLMIMIIMVIVFRQMFRFNIENYPVYLIIGSTLFSFMSDATSQAMWSIIGNSALLKKTYVPKYIFAISKITSSFINTLFSLGAMLIVFIVCGVKFNFYMFWIPVVLIQIYIFSIGLGLLLAQGCVFFRDIQHIYAAVLTAWNYLTPIFYPIEQLPEQVQHLIKIFNPMYSYVVQFRTIVLKGVFPDIKWILYGFTVALISLVVGSIVFSKTQDKFILYI